MKRRHQRCCFAELWLNKSRQPQNRWKWWCVWPTMTSNADWRRAKNKPWIKAMEVLSVNKQRWMMVHIQWRYGLQLDWPWSVLMWQSRIKDQYDYDYWGSWIKRRVKEIAQTAFDLMMLIVDWKSKSRNWYTISGATTTSMRSVIWSIQAIVLAGGSPANGEGCPKERNY